MKITRTQLRKIIQEEVDYRSEMSEFGNSRAGRKVANSGQRIVSAAKVIAEEALDQTGNMARALENISEFVARVGGSLASIGNLNEGESLTDRLPTVVEFKKLTRAIKKLEK
jgi:hypothetical protein